MTNPRPKRPVWDQTTGTACKAPEIDIGEERTLVFDDS